MSKIQIWNEDLPAECPPKDAKEVDNFVVYRAVVNIPVKRDDFRSLRIMFPTRTFKPALDCVSHALSCFDTPEKAAKVFDMPKHAEKYVVKIVLNRKCGRIKKTFQKGHYSWWMYYACDPTQLDIQVVKEKGKGA